MNGLGCLFFLLSLVGAAASAPTSKPNIIFILSDDIAQGDLGCYGQKLIQTPNLDQLCKENQTLSSNYHSEIRRAGDSFRWQPIAAQTLAPGGDWKLMDIP